MGDRDQWIAIQDFAGLRSPEPIHLSGIRSGADDDRRAFRRVSGSLPAGAPQSMAAAHECWLEQYYQQGIEAGGRVRDHLRDDVEQALKIFGNGFLQHPDNAALRQRFIDGQLTVSGYYRQLLRLIYRYLFLMVSEERRLVGPDAGPFNSNLKS